MRILIAEDDRLTRTGLGDLLGAEGYEVKLAASGTEALQQYRRFRPDLVCLDIMMPGKSGYDVCREIRKDNRNLPILFLSAKSEEIDKVLGLELGADDYMVKPFGTREIIARIKALLRRSTTDSSGQEAPEPDAPFLMDDLRVVPAELRAYRGGKITELTRRELSILFLLYTNRGKVVSKEELFDRAWGMNYMPSSRTLDQTIAQLRKKIETNSTKPVLIRTVHNAGYRWE
ncbi:MAG: response regulator transcription factor [Spirochaetales bacterium]|nr:response regulator transcription factor [Spirochaetales bacterium]